MSENCDAGGRMMEHELEKLDAAVDAFAVEMKAKLRAKAERGWEGWDNPRLLEQWIDGCFSHLRRLDRGDNAQAVDVANFALFAWYAIREIESFRDHTRAAAIRALAKEKRK